MKSIAKKTAFVCLSLFLGLSAANAKVEKSQAQNSEKDSVRSLNVPMAVLQGESATLDKKIREAILKAEAKRMAGYYIRRTRTVYVPRTRYRTVWVRRTRTVWVPRRRTTYVPVTRASTVYVPRRVTRTIYVRTPRRRVRVIYRPVYYRRTRTIFYDCY